MSGNRPLMGIVLLTMTPRLLVIYLPPLNPIFCTLLSSIVLLAVKADQGWRGRATADRSLA